MKLIIDSGSSKMHLCLLAPDGSVRQWERPGVNALMASADDLKDIFSEQEWPELTHVHFYGAGMTGAEVREKVRSALPPAQFEVEVESDLLGAARALYPGHEYGVAVILGTGSNSGFYNGYTIERNIPPLGFSIGDEGSGAVLGKLLVGDVLKGQLPQELCEKFLARYDLSLLEIIRRVYKEPQGNRFLASLTPFLIENINEPAIHALVKRSFAAFFTRNISHYDGMCAPVVNFIGSIAFYYRDVLDEAARECGYSIGTVLKSPMEGLISFHS